MHHDWVTNLEVERGDYKLKLQGEREREREIQTSPKRGGAERKRESNEGTR